MIEKLQKLILPVDDLIKEYRLESYGCKTTSFKKNLLTLNLVQNKDIQNKARLYITQLLDDPEQYGFLYYLHDKKLYMPLQVQMKGGTFMECGYENSIREELETQASQFYPREHNKFRITYVELLNFYIRLVNPTLGWIAVEYMVQCIPYHAHLIVSPDRRYSYREVCNKK